MYDEDYNTNREFKSIMSSPFNENKTYFYTNTDKRYKIKNNFNYGIGIRYLFF